MGVRRVEAAQLAVWPVRVEGDVECVVICSSLAAGYKGGAKSRPCLVDHGGTREALPGVLFPFVP